MKFKANPPQSIINVKKCNFPNSVLEAMVWDQNHWLVPEITHPIM